MTHQFSGGSINHPVSLHLRGALEGRCDDGDVEMAAFPRTGMAGMLGAVVADLEQGRLQRLLERGPELFDPRAHADLSGVVEGCWRMIQTTMPAMNTKASGIETKTLKFTQASRLIV